VITARDPSSRPSGGAATALTLDLSDERSIADVARGLLQAQTDIGALVNNAGTSFDGFDERVARNTLQVNVWGPLQLTDLLRPLMGTSTNVVMVSSGMGELQQFGPQLRDRLSNPNLGRSELHTLGSEFVDAVRADRVEASGFPHNAYAVSKALLNGAVRILQREWGEDGPRINAVCPGWVRTRMGGSSAPRAVDQGARGIVWAATLGDSGPRGSFLRDGKPIAW
jgi:NAD(P)-dependent dehydrogenase (short-subunit alcohol dehydrogenase family)